MANLITAILVIVGALTAIFAPWVMRNILAPGFTDPVKFQLNRKPDAHPTGSTNIFRFERIGDGNSQFTPEFLMAGIGACHVFHWQDRRRALPRSLDGYLRAGDWASLAAR